MAFFTCDICDAHEDKLALGELSALPPVFVRFGRQEKFFGQAVTLKVFEENFLVRAKLETAGEGRVLVIDGGGSLRCALVGGNLASLAVQNGWAGIIVNGCVRDTEEINACDLGIRALATFPVRSAKRSTGEQDVRVSIAGVAIHPGDWIYADADGVLVSSQNLLA